MSNHIQSSKDSNQYEEHAIDGNAVLSIANSIVESLYAQQDGDTSEDDDNNHKLDDNDNDSDQQLIENNIEISINDLEHDKSISKNDVYTANHTSKETENTRARHDNEWKQQQQQNHHEYHNDNDNDNNEKDSDFDFDQEDLIKNLVGDAVKSLEHQIDKRGNDDEIERETQQQQQFHKEKYSEAIEQEILNKNSKETNNGQDEHQHIQENFEVEQGQKHLERQNDWDQIEEQQQDRKAQVNEADLENAIADAFKQQFNFEGDVHDENTNTIDNIKNDDSNENGSRATVSENKNILENNDIINSDVIGNGVESLKIQQFDDNNQTNESATKVIEVDNNGTSYEGDNLDLIRAIKEALVQNIENIERSKEKVSQDEREASNEVPIEQQSITNDDENIEMLSLQKGIQDALGFVLNEEKNESSTNSTINNNSKNILDQSNDNVEDELTAAIQDALKNTESVLENRNKSGNTNKHNEPETFTSSQNVAFDTFYQDMHNLVTETNNAPTSNVSNKNIAENDNDNLVNVIQGIDLNDVMQNALRETQVNKSNHQDETSELNDAIKEALLSTARTNTNTKKKNTKKTNEKNKSLKSLLPNEISKFAKVNDNEGDISIGLDNVINNVGKDGPSIDKRMDVSASSDNHLEFEDALKDVVNGVIAHNLTEDKIELKQQVINTEIVNKDMEKDDYNWDAIMDNAFEMAMEYREDLEFPIDNENIDNFPISQIKPNRKTSHNHPITFVSKQPMNNHLNIENKKEKNVEILPESNKSSVIEAITNMISSIDLQSISTGDILKLKSIQIEFVKKNVSSILTNLMNSKNRTVKEERPTGLLDEKERLRFENRERKKRWREFNIERNRDIDLRTRVIKRANMLYPNPEHEELRSQWISVEFDKRKQRRLQREHKRDLSVFDLQNFTLKDAIPFDIFLRDSNNLKKIVEIYNDMGGEISEGKLLSPSSDKTVSISSIASVLTVAQLLKDKNKKINNDDIYSIIQSLVLLLDRYFISKNSNEAYIPLVDLNNIDTSLSNWNNQNNATQFINQNRNNIKKKNTDKLSSLSSLQKTQLKPMKAAPASGGISFKVQTQNGEKRQIPPPSFTADINLSRMIKDKVPLSNNSNPHTNNTPKVYMNQPSLKVNNKINKKDDSKPKRKPVSPVKVNFEKFLLPQPPPEEMLLKRKVPDVQKSLLTFEAELKKRKTSSISDVNNLRTETDDFVNEVNKIVKESNNDGLFNNGLVVDFDNGTDIVDSVTVENKVDGSVEVDEINKVINDINFISGSEGRMEVELLNKENINDLEKIDILDDVTLKEKVVKNISKLKSKPKEKSNVKPIMIPSIPLPHYGMPNAMKQNSGMITKIPNLSKKLNNEENQSTSSPIGIKRPGAFRKPGAFKQPSNAERANTKISKPFGGISSIKRV